MMVRAVMPSCHKCGIIRGMKSEKSVSVLVLAVAVLAGFPVRGECGKVGCRALAAKSCEIALPDEAAPVERSAAAELQDAIRRMSGVELPVVCERDASADSVLYVGATRVAAAATNEAGIGEWRYDEVFIRSVLGGIVFAGHPVRGALYAVDEWLEKFCGVRWWTPTESFYPKLDSLPEAGIAHRHAPRIKYRETYYKDGFNADFKVRLKGNFTSLTRYMLEPLEFIPPEKGGNHRLYFFKGRRSAYHSFFEILPPKMHFKDHPEWYSFITNSAGGGKRVACQLCLTNPEMTAAFVAEAKRLLREDPTVDFISISQNDTSMGDRRGPCECERCLAVEREEGGVHSGPILRFANKVAEELEGEFPNVRIDTFAYAYSREAPKLTKARRNVVVRFCDIACPVAFPMDTKGVPRCEKWMAELEDWKKAAPGKLFIWDYVTGFHNYMLPHPNLYTLGPNVRVFADAGAVGLFEQGDVLCEAGEFNRLKHWVIAHMQWNTDLDDRALIDEFTRRYYGAAAEPHLKRYFKAVNEPPRDSRNLVSCYHDGVNGFMKPAAVNEAWAAMEAALAAAQGEGSEFARRVRREKLSVDHAVILEWERLKAWHAKEGRAWPHGESRKAAAERWVAACRSFGVIARRETTSRDEFDRYCERLLKGK